MLAVVARIVLSFCGSKPTQLVISSPLVRNSELYERPSNGRV